MRRWAVGSLAFVVIAIGCEEKAPLVRAEPEPVRARAHAKTLEPDVSAVVEANDAFALDLYARLRERDGNLFFSPYSISVALAMTHAGARGETAAEMRKVLHFTLEQERLHPAFAKLAAGIKPRGCELHIANRLWGQKGYGFLESFLKLTEEHYGAGLQEVDFIEATEEARREINAWVEEKTREKIKELLQRRDITVATLLVLTNAIYFKGEWMSPFDERWTDSAPFKLPGRKQVQARMMHQTEEFKYAAFRGLQVLAMPYEGKELSMFVLLPRKVDGLAALEESLAKEDLSKWLTHLRTREVEVFLPKFKMESRFYLKETFESMGMRLAFIAGAADFSGMTGAPGLYIKKVVHEAFVDVNEAGTEAAAATAVVAEGMVDEEEPPVFRADHPFLFLIRDNRTGSILFLGRVVNPLEDGRSP